MGVLVNGTSYAWGSINLVLFGVPVAGITSINYKRSQVKENNYGAGYEPVGRGHGAVEYEGEIELYLEEWKRIIAASPDKDPLKISFFDVPVIMSGPGLVTTKDVLQAVEFKEDPFTGKQGDTKLMVTVPLVIGGVKHG